MRVTKLLLFIPAALLFVTQSVAAVEDLSPEEAQEVNQIYNRLEQQGGQVGGKTQQYMDETNNILQRDQPTERQIKNDEDAEDLLEQSEDHPPVQQSKPTNKAKARTQKQGAN